MKKIILINILASVFFIGTCYGQSATIKSKKKYTIDNPETISIKSLEKDLSVVNSISKTLDSEKQYNSDGKITKRISYRNDEVSHIATYNYDKLGNRTEWIGESNSFKFKWIYYYNSQGENYKDEKYHGDRLFQKYEYEFENGNVVTKRFIDSDGRNFWTNHYVFDSKGRKVSYNMTHVIKEQEELSKYKYDNNDNLLSQEMYNYKNVLKWADSNKYDNLNNKIETTRFDENNEVVEKAYLKYNNQNDVIEIKSYDKNNVQVDFVRYLTGYDKNDNKLIEVYIKDNVIKSIDIYEIEYYQ